MARLQRKSLPEQLASTIAEDIESGVWSDHLPGYRTLGIRYDVSRRACEGAMRILQASGYIAPSEPGKMRRILQRKRQSKVKATMNLLIVTDSLHPPTPQDARLLLQIDNFWKLENGEVHWVECDLARMRKPQSQLKKWLDVTGADCLLFDPIKPQWVVPVEGSGMPCYAMGGSFRHSCGILSGTGFHINRCIKNLLRQVLDLGHRHILVVMDRAASEEHMRYALNKATSPILEKLAAGDQVNLTLLMPDLTNPTDWQAWWLDTLMREQPSVILLDSVYLGLSLHDFCLTQGINMPSDLSIILLEDAEFLTWLSPEPTRYRYKTEDAFRHFRSWVRSGMPPGFRKYFGAKHIGGKTLGPVRPYK